jgi:hypothetical protein
VSKSTIKKKYRFFFDDGSENGLEADFLKEKWEVVLKTHVPATQQTAGATQRNYSTQKPVV